MTWKVSAEREELGQKPPGATIRQPCPHLRQCPLVFGGAPIGHEFRCRAKCRPRRDRAWAGFESRRRHLDRAEQRIQPPGPRVLQSPKLPATRATAAHRAVLGDPGLNQMPLHARQQSLAVVQRQAERIERRVGIGAATASDFVGLPRSIGAAQFYCHTPFHSRTLLLPAPTVAPTCKERATKNRRTSVPRLQCHPFQADAVADFNPATFNGDGAVTAEMREDAAHRLNGQAKMISHVSARHRQVNGAVVSLRQSLRPTQTGANIYIPRCAALNRLASPSRPTATGHCHSSVHSTRVYRCSVSPDIRNWSYVKLRTGTPSGERGTHLDAATLRQ